MTIEPGSSFRVPDLHLPAEAKDFIMLWMPPGTFIMGGREDEPGFRPEDGRPFLATLSKGFWLGQYLVTQAHWEAVMRDNPSHFQARGLNRPFENVSWYDALTFSERLNQRLASVIPSEYRFSLPTELQWEYACRAGTETIYHSGDTEADLARVAWYAGNNDEHTCPVGEKEPNAWGLYDMHGNVGEWCYDAPGDYPIEPTTDWVGGGDGFIRVMRSGSWGTASEHGQLRSAHRGWTGPETKRPWIGFRLCLRWFDQEQADRA